MIRSFNTIFASFDFLNSTFNLKSLNAATVLISSPTVADDTANTALGRSPQFLIGELRKCLLQRRLIRPKRS